MLLWYPQAEAYPGPSNKQDNGENALQGVIVHSAEGSTNSAIIQLFSAFRVSWHFTVSKDGSVKQHYPLTTITWHARDANLYYVGIEEEGIAGEPLTELQLHATVHLIHWISVQTGWDDVRWGDQLREHNEFVATACPSGRIPWDVIEEKVWELMHPPAQSHSVERVLLALQAAIATIWVYQDFDHIPQWDRDVIKDVFGGN